jgi:GxxExxY protein
MEDGDNKLTERIIGACIKVHSTLGPGLLESFYRDALCIEFDNEGITFDREYPLPILYENSLLGHYRLDLVVEKRVILELKATAKNDPLYKAQLLSYLRVSGLQVGLLINFHSVRLVDGITRVRL